MPPVFLALHTQESLFITLQYVFCFSTLLNSIALVCLLKQTPPNQSTIRKYLIFIQVLVIVADFVLELLCEPMPLIPLLAGYCCGWMCRAGVPVAVLFGIIVMLLSLIGVAVIVCCVFRHQTLLSDSHPLKMTNQSLLFRTILFGFFTVFPSLFLIAPIDYDRVERTIDEVASQLECGKQELTLTILHALSTHDMSWMRERCASYLFLERTTFIVCFCVGVFLVVIAATAITLGLFGHMYYVLHRDPDRRSAQSVILIRKSLIVLFLQLAVPLMLIAAPAGFIFAGLIFPDLITYEQSLTAFYVIALHSIGHNTILLSVTTAYRSFIVDFVRCKWIMANRAVADSGIGSQRVQEITVKQTTSHKLSNNNNNPNE